MAFTSQLGQADSRPGNFVTGLTTPPFTPPQVDVEADNTLALTQDVDVSRGYMRTSTLTFTQSATVTTAKVAHNTLALSHSVALALIVNPRASNLLNLTHVIAKNYSLQRRSEGNLAFDHRLTRVLPRSVTSTLVFSESAVGVPGKVGTNTLALSQSATLAHPYGRTVLNSLHLTQAVSKTGVYNRSTSSTLPLTQSIKLIFQKEAHHTLTLTQSVQVTVSKKANNTLTLTHDVDVEFYKYRRVFANITFGQVVAREAVLARSLTSTLALTQQVRRVIDVTASNTLAFSHSNTFTNSKYITSTLAFGQIVNVVRVYGRSVVDTLSLDHVLPDPGRVVNKRMLSRLQFTHGGRIVPIRIRSVTQTIPLTHQLLREVFAAAGSSLIDLSHSVSVLRVRNYSVVHNLALTHTPIKAATLNFNIAQTLTFPHEWIIPIRVGNLNQIIIPTVTQTVIPTPGYVTSTPVAPVAGPGYVTRTPTTRRQRDIMTIAAPGRTVILPVPLFGDKEGNTDQFTMSMAIDGTIYTTVKRSGTRAFSFEWDLAYSKGQELAEFVWEHNSKALTITTWKGEIWIARMTTNPVSFSDQLRPDPGESDSKIMVALEFEGVRIH